MISLLKSRRTWATAAIVAALSFLLAVGANQGIRTLLVLPDDAELPDLSGVDGEGDEEGPRTGSRPTTKRPPNKSDYKDPIVKRSLFDSTKVGLDEEDDGGEIDPDGGVASDMDAVLLATLVSRDPAYSSALISESGKGSRAFGFKEGDELFGQAQIVRIEQRRVIILRDGNTEYIDMGGEEEVAKATSRGTKKGEDEDEGIEKEGDHGSSTARWSTTPCRTSSPWPPRSVSCPTRGATARSTATACPPSDAAASSTSWASRTATSSTRSTACP